MNTIKKISLWLMGAAFAVALFNVKSEAALTQAVDIRVSINATKSILVGTTFYNYGALSVNVSSVSSPILVTNNSGALTESYALQGQDAASTQSGTLWTLASATSTVDVYALGAQFGTAQPANNDAGWASDDLTTSAVPATTDAIFGNGTPGETAYQVSPLAGSNTRNLWFRMRTPVAVSDTTQRLATVTLSIQ